MIPPDEYMRIVLGMKSSNRSLIDLIPQLPLTFEQRKTMAGITHRMRDDLDSLVKDLKQEGLID